MISDVRYGLRAMRSHPGFAAVAVASLALGIGVNTAMFSLVDQLLLWSVPARDPAGLVVLEGGRSGTYPFYREYRDRNQVFSGLAAASRAAIVGLRPEGASAVETGPVNYVSGNYFETLGVGAAAGRLITAPDDVEPGGSPIAVLSYRYWQRRFGGDLKAIGRRIAVNGALLEIAGVAEKGFDGLINGQKPDAFLPVTMYPATMPAAARVWDTPGMHWLFEVGRLKPGVTREQAQAAVRVLWPAVARSVNGETVRRGGKAREYTHEEQIAMSSAAHGVGSTREDMMSPLRILIAATGLVLLIACANIANLLLARAAARRKEIAVRRALGATRARLVGQLMSESLALAALGGVAGLAFAYGSIFVFAKAGLVDGALRLRPSPEVVAFFAGVTLLTAVLFGLAPAFRSTGAGLMDGMKEAAAGRSSHRLAKALVAGQVALSLTLLAGAGLFVRTLTNLERADIGFARQNVVIANVDPTSLGYGGQRLRLFYDQLLDRARRIRGVRSAALATMTPMGYYARSRTFSAEGYQRRPGEDLVAYANPVSEGYFTTLGIPMLLGRDFRPQDEPVSTPRDNLMAALGRMGGGGSDLPEHGSRVCLINESLARRLFGTENAVGRHLNDDSVYSAEGALEIVGVVKDVHHWNARVTDEIGIIYVPSWANGAEARWLAVRTAGDAGPVIAALRRELRAMDPGVPLLETRPLEEYVNETMRRERLVAWLSGFFGVLALGLAAVGLYGVLSHRVAVRTRELGVRMALGAGRGDIVAMVLRESAGTVAIGAAAGLAGALTLSRAIAGLLYGVAPRDPASLAGAVLVMIAVGLAAAAVPAHRASRVEPIAALRHE